MTYSLTDYAREALLLSGRISEEEIPSAAMLENMQRVITADTDTLAIAHGITMFNGNATSVPSEWLEPGARYHAQTMMQKIGAISWADGEKAKEFIRKELRMLCAIGPTGATQQAQYF